MALLDDFLIRALLGGIGVAVVAGPLGCVIVWRRMAYFGDSLAHSALLGVALGVLAGINVNVAMLGVFAAIAVALVAMQSQERLATDTVLGILAHTTLSLGLVAISFLETMRVDLLGYLFGDLLAVGRADLVWIFAGGAFTLAAFMWIWPHLLAMTIHEEMARAEGVPVTRVRLVFMLLIAVVIVLAMKIVGVLLITSLLIIPAAAARRFAHTPEQMAVLASAAGVLAVLGGLGASLTWDTPSGPSVVVAAAALFLASLVLGGLRRLLRPEGAG